MPDAQLLSQLDKRVGQIEHSLSTVVGQLHDQSKTLGQVTEALNAVVRIEERLTANIENSKEQRASIQRVHDRMDEHDRVRSAELALVYQRIEGERKECATRFGPVNDTLQQQHGALKFASVIFPLLATAALTLLGSVIASQQSELRELVKSASRHESYDAQLQSMRREIETKK